MKFQSQLVFKFIIFALFCIFADETLSHTDPAQNSEDPYSSFERGTKFKVVVDEAKAPRYLLYDVNPGEGFNLRRDVYMRIAVLVRSLNEDAPWILVLPPWSRIYHWRSRDVGSQDKISWSLFFDLMSLRRFVPVMEFDEFLKISKDSLIDELYYLQHYKEGWETWEEKIDRRPCIQNPYNLDSDAGLWRGWFFGYEEAVGAMKLECMSVMGHAGFMKPFLLMNTSARSVMLDRAETLLHDHYGDSVFWQCRRSMRFAQHLRDIADAFRLEHLDSLDEKDKTVLDDDWLNMKRNHGDAVGGPYIGVHLRRADFVHVRDKYVPSLKSAAKQLKDLATKLNLKKIFIATDSPQTEYDELREYLADFAVYKFEASLEVRQKYKDGGVAIIDQWICSHARFFIGTRESTFSFRIQDEREILGFDPETTFNSFCKKRGEDCEQPTKWLIRY